MSCTTQIFKDLVSFPFLWMAAIWALTVEALTVEAVGSTQRVNMADQL